MSCRILFVRIVKQQKHLPQKRLKYFFFLSLIFFVFQFFILIIISKDMQSFLIREIDILYYCFLLFIYLYVCLLFVEKLFLFYDISVGCNCNQLKLESALLMIVFEMKIIYIFFIMDY